MPKDYTGMRSGLLVATKKLPTVKYERRSETRWLFLCDCGNEKSLNPHDVFRITTYKNGKTNTSIRSCGCQTSNWIKDAREKPPGVAALNHLYYSYKTKCALARGYSFELTKDQFRALTKKDCYYCGAPPSQIKRSKTFTYIYNGIDRVDNLFGYNITNCVPACKRCNSLKSGVTFHIAKRMLDFKNGGKDV